MPRGLPLVGVAILVATLACGPRAGATSTPPPTPSPTPQPTLDAFDLALLEAAGADGEIAAFWQLQLAEVSIDGQLPFEPPRRVYPYHAGEDPSLACTNGTGAQAWRNNALYCRDDRSIAYSTEWLRSFDAEVGRLSPLALLAHEWGHHIQTLIGRPQNRIQRELQADCFAGMYLIANGVVSNDPIGMEQALQGLETFFAIGNERYAESEFFGSDQHGSPEQRLMAFSTGFLPIERALEFCDGYRSLAANDFTEVGPYRLLNLPGRAGSMSGQLYVIEPETRTGLPSSTIVLTWTPELPIPNVGATAEQLAAVWALDPASRPIEKPISLDANVRSGTGIAQLFESRRTTAGIETVTSGFFAIVSPASGTGGLFVFVERGQPAPDDPLDEDEWHVLQQELVTLYQVVQRLCGPDESDRPSADGFSPVCMNVQ